MPDKTTEDVARDFELAEIEKFYKNLPQSDKKTENVSDTESVDNDIATDTIAQRLFTKNTKSIILYSLTGLFCISLIIGAYILTIYLPGDEAKVQSVVAEKRLDENYAKLKSRYEELEYELGSLRTEAEEKKKNADTVVNYENTKADLRTKIEEKKSILIDVNSQLIEKQNQIIALDNALSNSKLTQFSLPPGKYTVGTNIIPGKYSVSGNGKFMVAAVDGVSKINMVLGADPYEVTLEKDDIIKLETTAKFTPIY